MILASSIGQIAHPFFELFALVLEFFYKLIPNYAVAIALLTIAVMIVVFPITRRGTRSMMKMQLLAPELKKIQARHKAQAGATVAEKQEQRQRLNEEMMALYKENGVSPTGGCLPMVMQFPIFWILYGTIKGIIHTHKVNGVLKANPLYISQNSRMYKDILKAPVGHLNAFGLNLADSVRSSGLGWGSKVPYIALILVAIALQYIQMKQLSGRNPAAAAANPQMQQMQKVFPIIFAVIYIAIPAGVNIYFIISSLFRISQQEFMYRRDPHITASVEKLRARTKADPKIVETRGRPTTGPDGRPKGLLGRLGAAQAFTPDDEPTNGSTSAKSPPPPPGTSRPSSSGGRTNGSRRASNPPNPKSQPRAQGKRQRRPR